MRRSPPLFAVAAIALSAVLLPRARADVVGPLFPAGELPRLGAKGSAASMELPLRHTAVKAKIVGPAARVEVTQVYENPAREPIEAVYVFPLPENAAVDDFELRVGDRVIRGEIQERRAARRTYEDARQAGNTAALLEQERPNVFTQSVANLPPGEEIRVVVRYAQVLAYDDGSFEFAFPMVVGPRYVPGNPLERANLGLGATDDTDAVADASRISPFSLPPGMRGGHDLSLEVSIDPGLPVRAFDVPTHQVAAQSLDDQRIAVRLVAGDAIPNRDFVLRYSVDGRLPRAALLTHRGEQGGFFTLIVQPPQLDVEAEVGKREIVFVVDNSGSMSGVPLWMCQEAMRLSLSRLRPVDTFNVITFAGSTAQAFAAPLQASGENVTRALEFVSGMRAGGGTRMLGAIEVALKPEVEPGRSRYVFFLTDGFVGNEAQIIAATRAYVSELGGKGQRGRVFGFGVGSSPNRHLLEGIASGGKGVAVYATNREDPLRAVMQFFKKIDRAILEDLSIDWGGLQVSQLSPSPTPDLFASRPLVLHGRYEGSGEARVTVRGYADGRKVEVPVRVALPKEWHGEPLVGSLWARSRVADLVGEQGWRRARGEPEDGERTRAQVVELGLAHRLVTPHTSFVAVDRSRRVGSGAPATVLVPVEVPEDVEADRAGVRSAVIRSGLLGVRVGDSSGVGGLGSRVGDSGGFGGLGMKGAGKGGGGSGYGAVGALGGIATRGRAGGQAAAGEGKKDRVGSVRLHGEPRVSGGLGPEVVRGLVTRWLPLFQYCHELASRRSPPFEGKLVLRLTLDADGKVLEAKIVLGSPSEDLKRCLLARAQAWRFPTSRAPSVIVVPLRFSAGK